MYESILIVEDDENVTEALNDILSSQNYRISVARNTAQTLDILENDSIDLLILDVHLEEENGYDLCRKVRQFSDIPIIFLTACSSEMELIRGFHSGGDDYITKPFHMQELIVRIQALLRRTAKQNAVIFKSGHLLFDAGTQQVFKQKNALELTVTELKLLSLLMQNWPRTLSREELLYQLWDKNNLFVQTNTLNVNVSRLRDKLGYYQEKKYIETIRGIGYRWAIPVKR